LLVARIRNPSYLHNTTGTFNLIVKDQPASRLSGALLVEFACSDLGFPPLPCGKRRSHRIVPSCPRNLSNLPTLSRAVNLCKLWNLRISTRHIVFDSTSIESQGALLIGSSPNHLAILGKPLSDVAQPFLAVARVADTTSRESSEF